jgi:hypothetical protein
MNVSERAFKFIAVASRGGCVRFKTRKEAERFRTETLHKASRGEYLEPAKVPIFREVAEEWFRSKSDRRPSHICDLRSRLNKHIYPVFGKERLDRIAVSAIEKLRDDLRERENQHRTINRILRIMGAATGNQTRPVFQESGR